jgi:two-component system, chemotaxis family, CheB/CheR fusion protein
MATKTEKMGRRESKTAGSKKRSPASRGAPPIAHSSLKGERPSYIVGMGASAGGLEAFETFFRSMPAESGMAFVLVPHLDPGHLSIMTELVQKCTKMEVFQIDDGMEVRANRVYVIPPRKDLAILHGVLQLIEPIGAPGPRMPIDYFFRSLAQDQGERAIAIILSGMGTDGTVGLRAIKGELGMAMAQDISSAKYDGMPRSAVDTGIVDYVLPPGDMPEYLLRYADHAGQKAAVKISPPVEGKLPDALQKVFLLLRTHTGHDFSLYKPNTLCRRIERRMNLHHIANVMHYVRYLQENPHEVTSLFKELLIGVTNFFRDPEAFEVLKKKALAQLLATKPSGESLRAWVPGCSSGEEAYSLAILLRECMDELDRSFDVQVFGTDIDKDAIEAARAGVYPGSIAADVSADRLKRFFTREDPCYRIKKDVREMVVFALQDIIRDPPFTKLDMICCRNLLIYLDGELQQKLLPLFHFSLKPEGILFLGASETVGKFVDLFAVVDRKWKVFKRKQTAAAYQAFVEFPLVRPLSRRPELEVQKTVEIRMSQLAEKMLLRTYAPPSVVIDEKGEILYIHGRTGNYLEPAPGEARWNIFDMAREGLRLELTAAVRRALSQGQDVTREGLRVRDNGGFLSVNVTVKPVKEPRAMQGLLLVVFEDKPFPKEVKSERTGGRRPKDSPGRIVELEQELQKTKEDLQGVIEELEASNEELKLTNEELHSTNEELQSANEEMESSKEELQSLNEELVTVNTELQAKNDELARANGDMRNLLDSTDIPTIFVDNDLCIKRFTAHAAKVAHLIPADRGRPLSHTVHNLKYEKLVEDAEGVLKTLIYREAEVATKDGHWYLMRIVPYRTIDNVIDGVVISFLDIHEQKMAAEAIRRLHEAVQIQREYAENIIDTLREPILVLDRNLRVISANRSFYRTFHAKAEETAGSFVYALGNQEWDIPRLRELLEKIIPKNTFFEDFEVEHNFPRIGFKKMLLNARRIHQREGGEELILLAIEDVTDRKLAAKAHR